MYYRADEIDRGYLPVKRINGRVPFERLLGGVRVRPFSVFGAGFNIGLV
jgi:hypothetical protein